MNRTLEAKAAGVGGLEGLCRRCGYAKSVGSLLVTLGGGAGGSHNHRRAAARGLWIFLSKEGDPDVSSDVAGGLAGCQVRFEVAVGDFERFLMVGKGASAATQECYVRHVQAMLAVLAMRRA